MKRDENRVTRDRYKLNLNIPRRNQVTFGNEGLKFYGPKIWNAQPFNIKTAENQVEWWFMNISSSALINSSFLIIIIKISLCI